MRILLYVLVCLWLIIGCTKTIYVPVESTRIKYRDNFLRDSIHIHDSIYIHGRNDTIWMEKFRTIYKDRFLVDSVFRQDTIRVPYPVDKIIYKNKTLWYQDILMYCGLGGIALFIIWFTRRRVLIK